MSVVGKPGKLGSLTGEVTLAPLLLRNGVSIASAGTTGNPNHQNWT